MVKMPKETGSVFISCMTDTVFEVVLIPELVRIQNTI